MPKHAKKSADHDMTARLLLFVVIVFIVTVGLVMIVSKLGRNGVDTKQARDNQPVATSVIIGENGITKASCEASNGFWIECGNPCHGSDDELCILACEPQCLCGGSNEWQCPADFSCTDYEKLSSDEKEVGVCRAGVVEPDEKTEDDEVMSGPIRETPEGMLCDEENFICIDEEIEGSLLTNPFEVSGSGIAFENTINWQLLDDEGNLLNEGFVTADSPDIGEPGDFTIRAFILAPPESSKGVLKVFEYSARDGEPVHIAEVSVELPTASMATKIFLPSEGTLDCSEVTAKDFTIGQTILPMEASIQTLLRESAGIPANTHLESIAVSNGTVRVVFSPELEPGGGSCAVEAIRAQIESTLKRFSSVNNVEISVTGKSPDETLQP